jgi:hypothetical protein
MAENTKNPTSAVIQLGFSPIKTEELKPELSIRVAQVLIKTCNNVIL